MRVLLRLAAIALMSIVLASPGLAADGKPHRIAINCQAVRWQLEYQLLLSPFDFGAHRLDRALNRIDQIDALQLERNDAARNPRYVQQIVEQSRHMRQLSIDHAAGISRHLRRNFPVRHADLRSISLGFISGGADQLRNRTGERLQRRRLQAAYAGHLFHQRYLQKRNATDRLR